jgi:cell division protein FtsL
MSGVRTKKKGAKARIFIVFFSVMLVTLFFVWTRLQNIRIRRDISRLNSQSAKINFENSQLKLRLAQITAPDRLEKLGAQKFRLRRPSPNQVIILREP